MTVEAADAIARGRVWTRADAAERGLVDELGGLNGSPGAKVLAGLDAEAKVRIIGYPGSSFGDRLRPKGVIAKSRRRPRCRRPWWRSRDGFRRRGAGRGSAAVHQGEYALAGDGGADVDDLAERAGRHALRLDAAPYCRNIPESFPVRVIVAPPQGRGEVSGIADSETSSAGGAAKAVDGKGFRGRADSRCHPAATRWSRAPVRSPV